MAMLKIAGGVSVGYFDDNMLISKSWFGFLGVIFAILALVWMVAVGYLLYILADELTFLSVFMRVLLPFIYVVILTILLYSALGLLLNKTNILINKNVIEVSVLPVPWRRRLRVKTADVNQLFVVKHENNKHGQTLIVTYEVSLLMKVGKPINLIDALDENAAKRIERQIEDYLGVKDEPVG